MAIRKKVKSIARVVSVYDDVEPLRFFVPGIVPGSYLIPGLAAPQEIFDSCVFSFPGEKSPFQYAKKKGFADGMQYVEISVVESLSILTSTDEQTRDEYGRPLLPPVRRVRLPIAAEDMANEIEHQLGFMGVMAIEGEVPTSDELKELMKRRVDRCRSLVQQANRVANNPNFSGIGITDQQRRAAWFLHEKGMLKDLPHWAIANPDAEFTYGARTQTCPGCGSGVTMNVVLCPTCKAVLPGKWKQAVDLGLKSPAEVPPSKRKEAGLDTKKGTGVIETGTESATSATDEIGSDLTDEEKEAESGALATLQEQSQPKNTKFRKPEEYVGAAK